MTGSFAELPSLVARQLISMALYWLVSSHTQCEVVMPRSYAMTTRAASMQRTREAILDAAEELFMPAWYDEVTLADVAACAGVSLQTVVNHFGTKGDLYLAGLAERYVPRITALRDAAVPGDVSSVVDAVLTDYEQTGDGTIRTLALAGRMHELSGVAEGGRAAHARFV